MVKKYAVRYAFCMLVLGASASCIYLMRSKKSCINLEIDQQLASGMHETISQFFSNLKQISSSTLPEVIKAEFPCIADLKINAYPQALSIHVTAQKPNVVINGTMVLTEQKNIYCKDLYREQVLAPLAHIRVQEEIKTPEQRDILARFLSELSPKIFNHYDIEWHHRNCVILHDKMHMHSVYVRADAPLPDELLDKIEHICGQEIGIVGKKKAHVIADARFDHQVIIYRGKGESHGSKNYCIN